MAPIDRFEFSYTVVECQACGMVYADHALAPSAMADYYRELSKYDSLEPHGIDLHRARVAAAFVRRVARPEARCLDVGCSTGLFLAELAAAGFARVAGIEPSPAAVAVARAHRGLDVAVGDAMTFRDYERFDVVSLFAVLEHLRDPRPFVDTMVRLLRPGALLIVEVPNADAFGRFPAPGIDSEPFGEFSIEHINFFGMTSLRALGHATGLSLVAVEAIDFETGSGSLYVAFRKDGVPSSDRTEPDTGASVRDYIAGSTAAMRDVDARLSVIAATGRRVIVYGAGSHSARLLMRPVMRDLEIAAIVDRNRNLIGKTMHGCTIDPPSAIARHAGVPVVVSTFNARGAVLEYVASQHGNPTVSLYPSLHAGQSTEPHRKRNRSNEPAR
jgi:SAM-dependent methyltransferase